MAKRTSRKQTKSKRSKRTKDTRGRKKTASRARRTSRTSRTPAKTRTARRKNAARATAARKTRGEAKPPEPSRLASAATAVKGAVAGAVAAVAKRLPGAEIDAITLLETDHRRLEDLLKQGEDTTERARKGRRELLNTITAELGVHELIEEKVLYPALKKYPDARDIVLEGFQEHHVADVIVKELHQVATSDEQWGAKFKVLKENIEHHIAEEEGPMFRTARGVMSREELQTLGARMSAMKREAETSRIK